MKMPQSTIYIIDDDQQMTELLSEYCQLLGYQSIAFTKASDFFDQIRSISDDSMMILDLIMPNMDGIEVMQKMIETKKTMPFILISGYDVELVETARVLAIAYSLDIIATIQKPFSISDLKKVIQNHENSNKH